MKEDLIIQLEKARERLLRAVEGLSEEAMTTSPAVGHWTIKDLLAHVAAWDEESLRGIRELLRGERPRFLDTDWDQWNAQEVEKRRALSLQAVLEELEGSHREFLEFLRGLEEAEWERPREQRWKRYKVTVAWIVGGVIGHDREHAEHIQAWRTKARKGEGWR